VQRKYSHQKACIKEKNPNHHLKVYKFIREHGGWVNWKMKIIGFKDCADHYEARTVEQNYFETLHATLNSVEPLPKPKVKPTTTPKEKLEKHVWYCNVCNTTCLTNKAFVAHEETKKHKHNIRMNTSVNNGEHITQENIKKYFCKKCNYYCSYNSDFEKHLLTAKHKRLITTNENSCNPPTTYNCDCGKTYNHLSSLYKHKNTCSLISNSIVIPENQEDKPSLMNIITKNQEIMDMLVLQNKEQALLIKEQSETIRELIPKICCDNQNTKV
jgi:hypothetical protein